MLSVDANFKQKARLRSDVAKDPPLGPGWGTFVENRSYLEHVARSTNQDEVRVLSYILRRICSSFYRSRTVSASQLYGKPTKNNQKAYERLA